MTFATLKFQKKTQKTQISGFLIGYGPVLQIGSNRANIGDIDYNFSFTIYIYDSLTLFLIIIMVISTYLLL